MAPPRNIPLWCIGLVISHFRVQLGVIGTLAGTSTANNRNAIRLYEYQLEY